MQIAFTVDLHRGNSRSSDITSHCERGSRQGFLIKPGVCLLQTPSFFFFFFRLFPIRGRHSGFSFSSCFYQLYLPPSLQPQPCPLSPHPYTSFLAFPVSSFLATPSSTSFSQYTHHSTPNILHIMIMCVHDMYLLTCLSNFELIIYTCRLVSAVLMQKH